MDENIMALSLEEKIEKSKEVVKEALERFSHPVVGFTGGKDSTLTLWLVREVCREKGREIPECMFIDEGNAFQEVKDYVEEMREKWNLSIHEVRNEDVLKQARKPGDTVYVKNLSQENRKELERIGFDQESFDFNPESFEGNHLMKTVAMNDFVTSRGVDAVITGIRWDEQEARKEELYFSPREEPQHYRIHPILHFTEKEVWEVLRGEGIPVNDLYARGYRSLGAKGTTRKVSDRPAWEQDLEEGEREGRAQDKEGIMRRLRDLGYM